MDLMLIRRGLLAAISAVRKILHSITSATGIASFTTNLTDPVENLTVNFSPVQSGTGDPSPSNVRPISGWTGVNVTRTGKNVAWKLVNGVQYNASVGTTFSIVDRAADINTNPYILNATGSWWNFGAISQKLKKGTYHWSWTFSSDNTRISSYLLDENFKVIEKVGNVGSGTVVNGNSSKTIDRDDCYLAWYFGNASTGELKLSDFVLEVGSTGTGYAPVSFTTVPVDWTDSAGTVYGGSLNVTTGVLTIASVNYDVYADRSNFVQGNGNVYIGSATWLTHKLLCPVDTSGKFASSHFKALSATSTTVPSFSATAGGTFAVNGASGITDTPAHFTAYLEAQQQAGTPVQFIFPLRYPQTIQLTPQEVATLKGGNTIWHSGNGAISLDYYDTV